MGVAGKYYVDHFLGDDPDPIQTTVEAKNAGAAIKKVSRTSLSDFKFHNRGAVKIGKSKHGTREVWESAVETWSAGWA